MGPTAFFSPQASIFKQTDIPLVEVTALRRRKSIRLSFISREKIYALLLGAFFLLGGLLGCLVAGCIHGEGGDALRTYLESFFSLVGEGGMTVDFGQVVWNQLWCPALVFLMGFTMIGAVGLPVLFALRGFGFVFGVACFFRIFGGVGIVPAVCLFGLPAVLWVPSLFVLGIDSMQCAHRLAGTVRGQGRNWYICIVCWGAVVVSALLEYFVLPVMVQGCSGLLVW